MNLLKAHPNFPRVQVQIHEQTNAAMGDLSGQEPAFGTDGQMELALRIFEIRSSAYLELVTEIKSQEAYMTILGEFARAAWEQYTGYAFQLLPPYGATGQTAWTRINARLSHWTHEGYRVLSSVSREDRTRPRIVSEQKTAASSTPRPIEVFASYSHQDEALHDELAKHLMSLEREGLIQHWHDREITAGSELEAEIDLVLNRAGIILLLISPDFIASDYCWGKEMKRALERHDAGEARVIPIILRPVDWHNSPFNKLLALPKDGMPVTRWSNKDEAFLDITRGIRGAIKQLRLPLEESSSPSLPERLEVEGHIRSRQDDSTEVPVKRGEDHPNLLAQKRISAGEELWSAVLDLKERLSAPVFLFTILHPSEFDSAFDENGRTADLVASITDELIAESITRTRQVEKDRPYLGETLWAQFFVYRAFLGRLAALITIGKHRHHICDWREDSGVRQMLASIFPAEELESLISGEWNPHAIHNVLAKLESLLLVELGRITSDESR